MIYFGPAGWLYKDWTGVFYPKSKPKGFDPLSFTAQYFDVVEINTTFYHPPEERAVRSWRDRVSGNPRFRFTAKGWRGFTHERNYREADIDQFLLGMDPLLSAGRLGALLLQFPWSFKNTDESRAYLVALARRLSQAPLVAEVRHESWNTNGVFELLKSLGVGFCNIDQPVIGHSLGSTAVVTGPVGYFRMHGRNYGNWFRSDADVNERYDYLYSYEELLEVRDLVQVIAETAGDTYVIANNHRNAQAASNALELQNLVTGARPAAPAGLVQAYPELKEFVEVGESGSGSLF